MFYGFQCKNYLRGCLLYQCKTMIRSHTILIEYFINFLVIYCFISLGKIILITIFFKL